MTNIQKLDSNSLQAYRLRVRLLSQELWQEVNQLKRMNIALQLADASTHLARMEAEELQNQHESEFNQFLQVEEKVVN